MSTALTRLEVWTDLECAGGTRLAFERDVLSAEETLRVDEGGSLVVSVPLTHRLAPIATAGRVLRSVLTGGTWREWRIVRREDRRDENGGLVAVAEGDSPVVDLGDADRVIAREEASGAVNHDFGLYGLTPTTLVGFILGWAPAHFTAGTIDPTDPVDLEFAWDSPLSALRQLAEVTGCELELDRDGVVGYTVSLRYRDRAITPTGSLRYRRNLAGLRRSRDLEPLITRAYPRGAAVEGWHADMSGAAWEVMGAAGSTITLDVGVVAFPGQLDGLYVEDIATAERALILDSGTDQVLTLDDVGSIGIGDRVYVRADAAGKALTYLDNPVAAAAYLPTGRHKPKVVDRPEIPGINNLAPSPFLDTGSGIPIGSNAVNGATLTRETSALYVRYGTASLRIAALGDGEGWATDWIPVAPTAESPYASAQVAFWLAAGAVRLELITKDGSGVETVYPADGGVSKSNAVGVWTENLAVGGIDLFAIGAEEVRIRLLAHGGGAIAYLDAAQLVTEAAPAETFYDGRSANDLWREANRELLAHQTPAESYDVAVDDLRRIDPDAFQADALELGAVVRVFDGDVGLAGAEVRIVEITRDLLTPAAVRLQLATVSGTLSADFAALSRRPRAPHRISTRSGASPLTTLVMIRDWKPMPALETEAHKTWAGIPTDAVAMITIHDFLVERPYASPAQVLPGPTSTRRPERSILRPAPGPWALSVEFEKPPEGYDRLIQVEPRDVNGDAGKIERMVMEGHQAAITLPTIEWIEQAPTEVPGATALRVRVNDPAGRAGVLYAWLNVDSTDNPDPSADPDGSITIAATPHTVVTTDQFILTAGGNRALFAAIKVHGGRGKRIFLEFVTEDGVSTGKVDKALQSWLNLIDPTGTGFLQESVDEAALALRSVGTYQLKLAGVARDNIIQKAVNAALLDDNILDLTEFDRVVMDNAIVAGKLAVNELSEIADDVGIVVHGELRNAAGTRYINLDAAGHQPFIASEGLTVWADGDAEFRGVLTASVVMAARIVQSGNIGDGAIDLPGLFVDGVVRAAAMQMATLSEIKRADGTSVGLGIVLEGVLRNAPNTAGIRLAATDTKPASWTSYLDLAAAGTLDPFLKHPGLELRGDGAAILDGEVRITNGKGIYFGSGGSSWDWGSLVPYQTGSAGQYGLEVEAYGRSALRLYRHLNVSVGTDRMHFLFDGQQVVTVYVGSTRPSSPVEGTLRVE